MEQIERANRYLQRIQEMYDGIIDSREDRNYYNDDVISFFVHCHHIRDWALELSKVKITKNMVNDFINSHEPLKICADLANGSKHCTLKWSRTNKQPHLASRQIKSSTWITSSSGCEVIKCKFTVQTSTGFYDALDLAEECMNLWTDFTDKLQNAHNQSLKKDAQKPCAF